MVYVWHIIVILLVNIWYAFSNVFDIYLVCAFGVYLAYIWCIFGKCFLIVWYIFYIYLLYVWYMFDIDSVYVCYIYNVCYIICLYLVHIGSWLFISTQSKPSIEYKKLFNLKLTNIKQILNTKSKLWTYLVTNVHFVTL